MYKEFNSDHELSHLVTKERYCVIFLRFTALCYQIFDNPVTCYWLPDQRKNGSRDRAALIRFYRFAASMLRTNTHTTLPLCFHTDWYLLRNLIASRYYPKLDLVTDHHATFVFYI